MEARIRVNLKVVRFGESSFTRTMGPSEKKGSKETPSYSLTVLTCPSYQYGASVST
jgi:hypothetical protein